MQTKIIFLTTSEVTEIHDSQIELHGGMPGLRDENLLESALGNPKQCFDGYFLYKNIYEMGAAYFISLATNHAFNDGNKRTAAFSVFAFLYKNGYLLEVEEDELVEFTVIVATQKPAKEEVAEFLRLRTSVIKSRQS